MKQLFTRTPVIEKHTRNNSKLRRKLSRIKQSL